MKVRWSGLVTLVMTMVAMTACGGGKLSDDNKLAALLPADFDGWTRADSISSFDRETIFKYINGAGEVYNSYAFSQVAVAHYARKDATEILVELFDMGNDADAYGAFSYARESEEQGIGGGFEQRGRVLCFWQNRYYCCVALESTGEISPGDLRTAAKAISLQLPAGSVRPALIAALPSDGMIPGSDRYFHLHAALNYNYYLARDNVLQLSEKTNGLLARYESGTTFLVMVEYPNPDAAETALISFRAGYLSETGPAEIVQIENDKNDKYVGSRRTGQFVAIVLDAASEEFVTRLLSQAIDNLGDLKI